ncbi:MULTISPECIES: flavin monoamine oxidase family protein [Pseudomonadota]|uniref:NAD(P)-binding protein n=2 Tax=Pseudomonadota TaxID=1224 RepID=A0A7Y1F8L6_PSEVE|nr:MULTISPECIES: FAD-dependent oxidoreductase [Pseudomonadota]NMY08839.1 NAD(P)-binding protein [Pseudomonas veronii]RCW67860.1 flavin-dependent amine oxidoreductase [Pseudorhodoferax soli]
MQHARIAIVGGGLSGLYAAALLEERGIHDYVVLEARETCGGRIVSWPDASRNHDDGTAERSIMGRFDLGATWYWPAMHPALQQLVQQLGLETVQQHEDGQMLIERSRAHAPSRVDGFTSAPPALRLAGGMGALVDAIRARLPADRLVHGRQVTGLRQHDDRIEVQTDNALGQAASYHVAHVLLAVPPKLAASTIEFTPALPDVLQRRWQACGTWMAPHAKYVAVYDAPFWREQGLSGEARSAVGPMGEIHDASSNQGDAALFGFLGVPAQVRRQTPDAVLLAHCRAQFVRLFGDKAARPKAEFLKDWATDPYTAVAGDDNPDLNHPIPPPRSSTEGPWRNRIVGIASEWSPNFPGYVAGAIEAARLGVEALCAPNTAASVLH